MKATRAFLAAFLAITPFARSQVITNGQWEYLIDYANPAAGKAVIVGYAGPGGAVNVPQTIGDLPVVAIRDVRWNPEAAINSVTLPSSVTYIGNEAFAGLGITNITIPETVTRLGNEVFRHSSLKSISIPDSVEGMGMQVFSGCTGLTNVTIGKGIKSIDYETFYGCEGLTNVTIPESVTWIASSAFVACTGLTNITIPDRVTSIGYGAFGNCVGLTNVTIGRSVAAISDYAFADCVALTSVVFRGNSPSVGGPMVFSGISPVGTVFYAPGTTSWGTTFMGWPTRVYIPSGASLVLEEPVGTSLSSGSAPTPFVGRIGVSSPQRVYSLRNSGSAVLENIAVAKSGPNSNDFILAQPIVASLNPGAAMTFSVTFVPTASPARTAVISVASSDTSQSPFLINLLGLSEGGDQDGDGLNDAAEWEMSSLGFNWQSNQPTLVAALYGSANRAQLFTQSQHNANRTNGRSDVTTKPSAFGLYTLSQYNANRANGRTDVIRSPSAYSLVHRTNVPTIRIATKRGNSFTLSLPGSWTRYAQSGMPRGWKFDAKKGVLRGTMPKSGMPSVRLTPYRSSSPGAQVTVQFQPTAK